LLWLGLPFYRTVEVSILTFAAIFLVLESGFWALGGFRVSSEFLHLAGLAVGLPAGSLFLKRGWVNCEGWDCYSLFRARQQARSGTPAARPVLHAPEQPKPAPPERQDRLAAIDRELELALAQDNDIIVAALFAKHRDDLAAGARLSDSSLLALIAALHRETRWQESHPFLMTVLQRHPPEYPIELRLNLARSLLEDGKRPQPALAVLEGLPPDLTPQQHARRRALMALADEMAANGPGSNDPTV
jgi:hypothetical protein